MSGGFKSLVLLSGGIDSVTLAADELRRGTLCRLLFVDYGQPAAEQERRAAEHYAREWCVPIGIITVGMDPSDLRIGAAMAGPRVVAGRNALLASLGVHEATRCGARIVLGGATFDDQADYRDCRGTFARAISSLFWLTYQVRFDYPFAGLTRAEVIAKAGALGVDLSRSWSCYEPIDGAPCGGCNSCRLRAGAAA